MHDIPSPQQGSSPDALMAEKSVCRHALLQKLLKDLEPPLAHAVAGTLRSSIDFYHAEKESYAGTGNMRLGGMADLPEDIPWPTVAITEEALRECEDLWEEDESGQETAVYPWDDAAQVYHYPMEFLAQIDCHALSGLQDYLPRDGMLFFFLDCGSSMLASCGRVIYVADKTSLRSGKRFAGIRFNDISTLGDKLSFRLEAKASVTAPSFYALGENPHIEAALGRRLDEAQKAALADGSYEKPLSTLYFPEYYAWQLRAMDTIDFLPDYQGIARINGCGFSQHELPELQAANALGGDVEDYLVLFKVCLDGQFHWGYETLNIIIHRDDLAALRFDRIYMACDY